MAQNTDQKKNTASIILLVIGSMIGLFFGITNVVDKGPSPLRVAALVIGCLATVGLVIYAIKDRRR